MVDPYLAPPLENSKDIEKQNCLTEKKEKERESGRQRKEGREEERTEGGEVQAKKENELKRKGRRWWILRKTWLNLTYRVLNMKKTVKPIKRKGLWIMKIVVEKSFTLEKET